MYSITDDQIDFILNDITRKGIVTVDVRDNILDHVCCIIEHEMTQEKDFFKFYENTIARFYQKELREIEDETRDLITFKYFYAMKRTLKITGFLSAALIVIGGLFKLQHWPGAGIALFSGLMIFSLLFLPLNIILKYRDDKEKKNRLIMLIGFLTAIIGTLGILFKIMHWPGANIMFYGSFFVFFLVFIPIYFFSKYKNPETKFNAVIHTTFMIAACGMLMMLFSRGDSKKVITSIESMDTFQSSTILNLKTSNLKLYEEVSISENSDLNTVSEITSRLSQKIEAVKVNLIAKTNGISNEEAAKLSTSDVKYPNDSRVVHEHFEEATGDLSYKAFKTAVEDYNKKLELLEGANVLLPVEIEKLQMTETIVSVVLHELLDIQVQVLSNENSYLNLRKGLLVQNN